MATLGHSDVYHVSCFRSFWDKPPKILRDHGERDAGYPGGVDLRIVSPMYLLSMPNGRAERYSTATRSADADRSPVFYVCITTVKIFLSWSAQQVKALRQQVEPEMCRPSPAEGYRQTSRSRIG